jgi:hypothetical protein
MPLTQDLGKMYDPRISDPVGGSRGWGGFFYGPSNNPIRDIMELESVKEQWRRQQPDPSKGLPKDKIKKHKDRVIKQIELLKKGLSREQTQQYHDALIEKQQREDELREQALERLGLSVEPRQPYGPLPLTMAEDIPIEDRPNLGFMVDAQGRYAENLPILVPDIADSSAFDLQPFLESTLDKVNQSTNNHFTVSTLFINAVEQTLEEGNADNLGLLREIFAVIKQKTGPNYAVFRSNFSQDILRQLEAQNIGRGLAYKGKKHGFIRKKMSR